jgi:hypothetical protein
MMPTSFHPTAKFALTCVRLCCCTAAGEYKYGWHALPRQFKCGSTKIVSGRASCDYGIRRRSIDAFNVSWHIRTASLGWLPACSITLWWAWVVCCLRLRL